jgi:hypothetical protein
MQDQDKTIEKGYELHDDDSLADRLGLAQRITDKLTVAPCPVKGHSLAETLGTTPPLFRFGSLFSDTHEGAPRRTLEQTPAKTKKPKKKPPTQSPGKDKEEKDTEQNQIGGLTRQEWELMKTQAAAVIRHNLTSRSLSDLQGTKDNEPKEMMFAITGLRSDDPQDQVDEIMEEIGGVKLTNPLDFTAACADIAALKRFMDSIQGAGVKKKKWPRTMTRMFSKSFPTSRR